MTHSFVLSLKCAFFSTCVHSELKKTRPEQGCAEPEKPVVQVSSLYEIVITQVKSNVQYNMILVSPQDEYNVGLH